MYTGFLKVEEDLFILKSHFLFSDGTFICFLYLFQKCVGLSLSSVSLMPFYFCYIFTMRCAIIITYYVATLTCDICACVFLYKRGLSIIFSIYVWCRFKVKDEENKTKKYATFVYLHIKSF